MTSAADISEPRSRLLQELLSGEGRKFRLAADAVEPRAAGEDAPLSPEQMHVWMHSAVAGSPTLYNEAVTVHRNGPFSLDVLRRAFNELLRRHEIWRTSIEMRDGRPRLVAHPGVRLDLPLIDLTRLAQEEREPAATRIAAEDARQPFDFAKAPLIRGKVLRLGPDRHRICLTLHHIVFDGVTIYRILMPELSALYAAFEKGEPSPLAEPRLQYADYAVWREKRLASGEFEKALAYWRGALGGELPELALPADFALRPGTDHRGGMETFELTPHLTTQLKDFSRREGVTLYATLLTAFKALLHRLTGQEDILIGGVTDTRRRPELEALIGYFLNSLALRTRPRSEMSFRDYLSEVQATVVAALDASAVPFDRVVRDLKPRRDGARHPLFQVLFSIEPPAPSFAPGWDLTQMDVSVETAKFDLYLELDDRDDRVIGRFLYAADLFEPATIRRMIERWLSVLHALVENPGIRLGALPVLTDEEKAAAQADTKRTPYPEKALHDLVQARAARTPDAMALQCGDVRWTYAELERRAESLAAALSAAGVGSGQLVGVATRRSPDMVAALLATMKTGAAFLPLDPALPAKRLDLLVEDARPAAILSDAASKGRLPQSAPIIDCGELTELRRADPVPTGANDIAYVLYTSGSTGRPKAVEIRHGSVVNLLESVRTTIGFEAGDGLLAVTTLSFDIAMLELFLPLIAGGRVVIAEDGVASDPARLAALMDRSDCAVMQATPATWRSLIASGWRGDRGLTILCGGEALPTELARSLLSRCRALWNMYGPTETTIWSLCHRVTGRDDPIPIGRPLGNTFARVVDRNGAPVPDLTAGELLIGGDGLARGYRNAEQLTAEKFPTVDGRRVYRTGDRVRRRPDGVIEFLGRADNLVKVRGFRVGLEEVEAAVAQHPRVRAAAVAAWPDASGELSLAGYITGDLGAEDLPDLRQFLQETLPAYMTPATFSILPALPMNSNGKVDRKQLPRPAAAPRSASRPPREGLERRLADIWRDVLGIEDVGAQDDFFELGGHSLLAAVLIARIQAATGRELPLAALFRTPTIEGLAEALSAGAEASFSHLVKLREAEGRPLFIVHGIFGNVLDVKNLAEALGTPRPIYAIQARGVDPRSEPHGTLSEMVGAYVAAIRDVQPTGPYALAGYSFGGLIAFEMARQLRAAGEQIELLALLETDVYARYLPLDAKLAYYGELVRRVAERSRKLSARDVAPYLMSKISQIGHRVMLGLGVRDDFVTLDSLEGPAAERGRRMYQIAVREFRKFKPRRYDGRLCLFNVPGPRFGSCDATPIWRRAAAAVERYDIDGEHNAIMTKPYVSTLAEQFDRCLAAAEGSGAA